MSPFLEEDAPGLRNEEVGRIISNWNKLSRWRPHQRRRFQLEINSRRPKIGRAQEPKRFRDLMRQANRDRAASRVAVSILKADSRVAQVLERALAGAGLTLPQFNLLMELAASADAALPLYDINARLISTPPNTSWLCTRMEQSGLLRRRRDTSDGRVVMIGLTETGWVALRKAAPIVFEAEKDLLSGYSRAELHGLAALLTRLLE